MSGQRICRLAEEAAEASDPEVALERLMLLRAELADFERQQVARALTSGSSFGTLARAMGLSRQAVHRRFSDLKPRRRRRGRRGPPPSPEVRLVFDYARAEAEAVRASTLDPAHVVLGILRNGDPRAAAALATAGVTLEEARREVAAVSRGAGAPGAAPPAHRDRKGAVDIRAVLAGSVHSAAHDGAERIEVEHVLRAALAEMDGAGEALLHRLGVQPARIIEALDALSNGREERSGA